MDASTELNLLTREGIVSVEFTPPLDQDQYSELYDIARDSETREALVAAVKRAARRWKRKVKIT